MTSGSYDYKRGVLTLEELKEVIRTDYYEKVFSLIDSS